ncbi:hypothetical protein ACFSL4_24235 [Streptomyces caeni]|uniref:Uncharacterized protein n=1 Tax=Streptomyces caeni TaxID=2307231 RepID=A0ABW4IY66_9ACTN
MEMTKRAQIRDAKAARDELGEALADAGVLLPSLGLDAVSLASDHLSPLVDLGRCNPSTARRLAAALRHGSDLLAKVREANRQSVNRPR